MNAICVNIPGVAMKESPVTPSEVNGGVNLH